jgi:hypothetical protein
MSGASKSPHDPVVLAQRMAAGEAFGTLFREGMNLVEAAAAYLDATKPRSFPVRRRLPMRPSRCD